MSSVGAAVEQWRWNSGGGAEELCRNGTGAALEQQSSNRGKSGTGVEQEAQPWSRGGAGPAAVERCLRCPSCGTESGSECCVLQEPALHATAMPVRLTRSGGQLQQLLLGCGRCRSSAFDGDLGV